MASHIAPDALPGIPVLEQTPIIVEKIIRAATEEEFSWKPSAHRWSISEVLSHLAEVESAVFRPRAIRMIEEQNPALESYDQNAAYAAGKYSVGKAREHLKAFCHERDRSLSFLRYVPQSAIARTARHAELGPITLGHLMNHWAFHDLGHIRQIAELYRYCAFHPLAGPFQRDHAVNPRTAG